MKNAICPQQYLFHVLAFIPVSTDIKYTHNFHYWEMYKDDKQQGYILKEMIVY